MKIKIALQHYIDPKWSLIEKTQAKLVQLWTKSKYFHVELVIDNYWVAAHTYGIRIYDLKELNHKKWDYIELEYDISEKHKQIIIDWINEINNSEYDWKGIFLAQVFKSQNHNLNKWFCSELTMKILQLLCDPKAIRTEPHNFSPADIYRLYKDSK